jgi:hypothetical protein
MSETYLTFDFGTNEDAAQQARHKLDGWKQAFRLDKKLLFKFERGDAPAPEPAEAAPAKAPAKGKEKSKEEEKPAAPSGTVKLLVRLYFSGHEKLSEQRWIQRLPAEDPFKAAAPRIVPHGDAAFAAIQERFQNLT